MAIAKTNKSKSVKSTRKGKYIPRKKLVSTKQIEKVVEDKVNVMAEKKTAYATSANWDALRPITDISQFTVDNIKILTPADSALANSTINIPQSQFGESDERVGNKIKTFSAHLNLMVRPNTQFDLTSNYNPQPMYVKVYFVKIRPQLTDSVNNLITILQNTFFENGGTSVGFTGTIIDFTKMINSNTIDIVKTKTYKLGHSSYISGFGVNNPNNTNQQFTNNDFKLVQQSKFDLTKYHNKSYFFNDGTNDPNARRLYMFLVPFRIDGTIYTTQGGSSIGPLPAYYTYNYLYKFTDF